ncbi:MAG: Fur family transcriptional regulator [Desulfobulbaceae bacterium]|jgi:Fur family peroxide stress response transcriptional regulator|nr:Fur family transcriptional regulator [Desulfobulbaceae bacterium]MDY0350298.1 Fur family transcriptional regulator [Desulfobulbaceae bacterium]
MLHHKDTIRKKMARFEQACRDAGLKITHQRLEIYRELAGAHDHPTAEMLYTRLRERLPTLSLDTVYRTLATLEEQHIITRVQTDESQARYEAEMTPHHHVMCRKCGRITDFHWTFFDAARLPEDVAGWGTIEDRKVTVRGICRQCAAE